MDTDRQRFGHTDRFLSIVRLRSPAIKLEKNTIDSSLATLLLKKEQVPQPGMRAGGTVKVASSPFFKSLQLFL